MKNTILEKLKEEAQQYLAEPAQETFIERKKKEFVIDASIEYPDPEYLIEIGGVPTLPRGNLVALSAKWKNGKTFLCDVLSAIFLGSDRFAGCRPKCPGGKVQFFDTEQAMSDTARILKTIHAMTGEQRHGDIHVYCLRNADIDSDDDNADAISRFDFISQTIALDHPDLVLAKLRSRIQFLSDTCFIFSGSVRRDMVSIFTDYSSPFYKSAAMLNVGAIDDDVFISFLRKRFAVGKRKASPAFLRTVIEAANRISGDVQQLCDAIWLESSDGDALSEADLRNGVDRVLKQERTVFELQTQNLTRYQMKALVGVASLGGKHVFSTDFITRAGLSSAPTAKRALEKLIDMGILYFHDSEYKIFNPFLKEWLKRT